MAMTMGSDIDDSTVCPRATVAHEEAGLLTQVDVPVPRADVVLTSGRRYELAADGGLDRLTVRSGNGRVLLCIVMTDNGPVLSFEAADLRIAATRTLALSAEDVTIDARRALRVRAGGDCSVAIGGNHHTRVEGAERLEAAAVEVQANEHALSLRAAGKLALDAEHIGLNDDPCPQPFAWSAIAP